MNYVGTRCRRPADVYFTGGASAVLMEWRETTIDLDIKVVSDSDELLRCLPEVKESLKCNIELAAPDDFVPALPGWLDRRVFVERAGTVSFFHYDFYSQALSKVERGHGQDLLDVNSMIAAGLVLPGRLLELFTSVEGQLYRYPAVDPKSLRTDLEALARGGQGLGGGGQ